jgi:ribonuclease BN (tRNA processing enzyme)
MRVTLLGTGTALPTGDRYQSGALVESADQSRRVLVDCGCGVLHRLAETDVGYEAVDGVLLTHTHLDHVADIPSLVKARVLSGITEMEIVGPSGTGETLEHLLAVDDIRERADLTVREVEPGRIDDLAGFEIRACEADHSVPTLGYRFDGDGTDDTGGVTFSGDTSATESVADLADGSAVLVHDCAHPDGEGGGNHATPSELAGMLAGRDVDTVYLTHLYPDTRGKEGAMSATVEGRFDGEVKVANDLETFEV